MFERCGTRLGKLYEFSTWRWLGVEGVACMLGSGRGAIITVRSVKKPRVCPAPKAASRTDVQILFFGVAALSGFSVSKVGLHFGT